MMRRAGDWKCSNCNDWQFASRAACRDCHARKPAGDSPTKAGDWECPKCHDVQFASRDKCRDCGTKKPTGRSDNKRPAPDTGQSAPPQLRKGDWWCSACKKLQFARNVTCRDCDAQKPVREDENGNDLDDPCVVCFENTRNAAIKHGKEVHVSCCLKCAEKLKENGDPCPMCRKPIDEVMKAFK